MTSASLDFDPASITFATGHFIGGQIVNDAGPTIAVKRPSDGSLMGHVPDGSADTIDRAVTNAQAALRESGWATRAPRERAAVLRRWADLIMRDRLQLAQLEATGSVMTVNDLYHRGVPVVAETIRFFAECADKYSGDVLPTRAASLAMVVPEPYGVVGAITPWNYPLSMAGWKCGPALAAGNAVVVKPSELTPFSTLKFAELAIEAGLPPGILNVVNGSGASAGAALVRHPGIGKVSFTGSTATGASVMSDAAHFGMKPVTLELGGKSPQLVFDDAGDISKLADDIVRGFVSNGGQACVSGTRLIVQRGISERLLEAIVAKLADIRPGPTWMASSKYSPLINGRHADKVGGIVDASIAQGARALAGGGLFEDTGGGFFYRPTLLTDVLADTPAVAEEIFGPVLTAQVFDDEEEGLAMAGHPIYGLAAGVHTMDISKALRAVRRIAAGTVWVNRYGRTGDFIVPTGGFGGSGIGKDLGRHAFEASLRYKSVVIDF